MSGNDQKNRERREAEERLRALLTQATDPDRKLAEQLLRQRRTTFGISMMCLSPFVVTVAIMMHDENPGMTPIVLSMAITLLVVGALHIERVNITRRNLASKFLRRLEKLRSDRDQ